MNYCPECNSTDVAIYIYEHSGVLIDYGKESIDFYKIDDDTYYLDF
tara:strand:- start:303 stop:440 length:138 start_codon:yes stop_codon:yes gene_type:complete